MALTTAQIHAAANQIDKQGNRPTLASVRAILGGGSFTTIQEGMKTWKKVEDESEIDASEIPDGVINAGESMMAKIWELATKHASEEFAEERKSQMAAAAEQNERFNELMKSADDLAAESEKLTGELMKKQSEIEAYADELHAMQGKLYKLEAALHAEKQISKERLTTIKAMSNDNHQEKKPEPVKKGKVTKKTPINGELELQIT
jgi:predicted RNase H-like nuclease (RuvC/YqgF family)